MQRTMKANCEADTDLFACHISFKDTVLGLEFIHPESAGLERLNRYPRSVQSGMDV